MECEKPAKGHKAAPLCTPLGLFLQSAAIVEHGKLLTYTCMLLYWQFNTKPKCDKQKVLQKNSENPADVPPHVESLVAATLQQSAQRSTSNTEEYKNKPTRSHIPTTKKFSKKARGVCRGAVALRPLCGFPQLLKAKNPGPLPRKQNIHHKINIIKTKIKKK